MLVDAARLSRGVCRCGHAFVAFTLVAMLFGCAQSGGQPESQLIPSSPSLVHPSSTDPATTMSAISAGSNVASTGSPTTGSDGIEAPEDGLITFAGGDIFGDVAAGAGSIWVPTLRGLIQVDPMTMEAVWHEGVGQGRSIVFAFGSLWVASGEEEVVTRVDPKTVTETASITVQGYPEGIATDSVAVYVTQHHGGGVSVIDPMTNMVARNVPVADAAPRGPMDPTIVDGELWFALPRTEGVVRVSTAGEVTHIDLPDPAAYLLPVPTPSAMWLSDGSRWLTRVDRATNEARLVEIPAQLGTGGLSNGLAIGDLAWFPGSNAMVGVDDAGTVVATVPLRGGWPRWAILEGDNVWVISEATGSLERIALGNFDRPS